MSLGSSDRRTRLEDDSSLHCVREMFFLGFLVGSPSLFEGGWCFRFLGCSSGGFEGFVEGC